MYLLESKDTQLWSSVCGSNPMLNSCPLSFFLWGGHLYPAPLIAVFSLASPYFSQLSKNKQADDHLAQYHTKFPHVVIAVNMYSWRTTHDTIYFTIPCFELQQQEQELISPFIKHCCFAAIFDTLSLLFQFTTWWLYMLTMVMVLALHDDIYFLFTMYLKGDVLLINSHYYFWH